MKMENLLRTSDVFSNLKIERVLFEANYPVLFSCTINNNVFMFICHELEGNSIKWIASKTTYPNLIKLLQNKITIREAFLRCSNRKMLIEYNAGAMTISDVLKEQVPEDYLPTAGIYMDSDMGEFDEEIKYYSLKNQEVKQAKGLVAAETILVQSNKSKSEVRRMRIPVKTNIQVVAHANKPHSSSSLTTNAYRSHVRKKK